MPVTTDDQPGARVEEEVQFEDRTADGNPSIDGAVRFVSDDLVVKTSTGVKSLTAAAGGGITESQHEGLDRLTHRVNETGYEEYIYTGQKLTSWVLWTSAAKTLKIREEQYTYTGNLVTTFVEIQYDGAGTEKERNTLVLSYSGNKVSSITRTHA